jgi:hypothetical protein
MGTRRKVSYEPVSNVSARILSKTLANRTQGDVIKILNHGQVGFIPGRKDNLTHTNQ